ncbi:MAG TPA: DUF4340 domain-containing protein [Candidatus Acidoferrales bacterium]|nr:DUF4340 domain-containing protein [Candidatus Acidoferrales bacterium]
MIKKPTLIVVVCAIILGGAVYYFQWRKSKNPSAAAVNNGKPAFTLQSSDVADLAILHPGEADQPEIRLAKQDGTWNITQPLETGADQSAVNGIADGLASARVTQTEPDTPDRLKAFGLDSPQLELDFQTKSGAKHKITIGNKDFTGSYVYSLIDGQKSVSLLPLSLYMESNKPVEDLRDRKVLHIDSNATASVQLRNSSGELALTKKTVNYSPVWSFTKPSDARADSDGVSALVSAVSGGTFTTVASEKADSLQKYGLAHPAITFTAISDKGKMQTLEVGKKEGDNYFARDDSRPTIFLINADLYKKLDQGFGDLRDKDFVHIAESDCKDISLQDSNGTMTLGRKPGSDFEWLIDSPASDKGKSAQTWKLFDPLTSAKADAIIDHPSAAILSKFAKPAIEVDFTKKDGKKLTVKLSKAEGNFIYGQSSGSPSVYKLKKSILKDLDVKASDLIS